MSDSFKINVYKIAQEWKKNNSKLEVTQIDNNNERRKILDLSPSQKNFFVSLISQEKTIAKLDTQKTLLCVEKHLHRFGVPKFFSFDGWNLRMFFLKSSFEDAFHSGTLDVNEDIEKEIFTLTNQYFEKLEKYIDYVYMDEKSPKILLREAGKKSVEMFLKNLKDFGFFPPPPETDFGGFRYEDLPYNSYAQQLEQFLVIERDQKKLNFFS